MTKYSRLAIAYASISLLAFFSAFLSAQTLSLSDGTIVQGKTKRIGLNIGSINYYDNGQILKNLIGSSNPGFEPLMDRQIWALGVAGTTTTFSIPNIYDGMPTNYWAGATFNVVASQSGGAELGCSGTIASNTGPNYPVSTALDISPVMTTSAPCAAPFSIGDIVIISKSTYPTPEAWWELDGRGGTQGSISGGGQLLSDTTDLCATCGTQALNLSAVAAGSSATASWYFDGSYGVDTFVQMNGTYELSFWAKAGSGTPKLVASALRLSKGGFNCGSYTPTLTNTWKQYNFTCTASESVATTTPGTAQVQFQATGGSVLLDNVSFARTNSTMNNPTVLRDEVVQTLLNYYGTVAGAPAGVFRYWVNQNGETLDNWTQPDYLHAPSTSGGGYFVGPGGSGSVNLSLEDYLVICQLVGAEPYLEVPVTFSTQEAANLIEFLAAPSGTTYGNKRSALGQSSPWTDVFDQIHLSFCNECWNGYSFSGQSLPDRSSQPNNEFYYDYSVRAGAIFAAMRADAYYNAPSFDLVMNAQTATSYTMDIAIQRARPDSIEIEDYTYGAVFDFGSDAALWGPAFVDPWQHITNPNDGKHFYQSVHDYQSQNTCGPKGASACNVNVYEWGQGTISGSIDQAHIDYVNAGAGQGIVAALQPLLNMQYYGILPQSLFSLTEYQNGNSNGGISKLWGSVVDMGGATNNVRPEFLGVQLINQSIIGPMYSCPIANNLTFNFAGSPNGVTPMPAMSNVPYLYAFCFENGTKRSIVLVNTDLNNSHSVSFGGSNPPTGTVTQRQLAPTNLNAMNEAPTGSNSSTVAATVAIATSTLNNPASISLPAHSVTALDYTSLNLPVVATPSFSPVAGTYTTAQSVTISNTTPGSTIYYTTDGTVPTTSSSVYSGPITVSANQTLKAMATENNFTNSVVGSAAYVIAPVLPTPTFSLPGATYTTAQTVTISESASGSTIYYTTDGTNPTTSSAVYSGPLSITANETVKAIAVRAGNTNSLAASATYIIAPVLATPTFSPGTGTYSTTQSVTITSPTAGTTIYYTTNGTTPTTASSKYTGAISVSANETLQAIAVASGYTNSAAASATYSILGCTSNINITTDAFVASSMTMNGGASVSSSGTLMVTDGGAGESRSAWFSTKVPIQNFVTDFTFQQTKAAGDGMTFTIQGQGPTALGGGGGNLGYQGITNSLAIKFDLYSNAGEGSDSTGMYTGGASPMMPSIDLSSTGIDLHSSDVMNAHLVYDGTNLTMTLTDTVTSAAVTEVFPVNISSLVGGTTAYVGFTGGTGGNSAVQQVLSWTYVSKSGTNASAPVFSPAAGTYATAQNVTISDATSGATIYYTTNGATPSTASTVYSGPITVSSTQTLQAIAVLTGYLSSPVTSASYTIAPTLPTPVFSVAAGTYASSQSVTISDTTAGTTIYYTTNGAAPTTASTVYSSAITVSSSQTLKAIAVKTGYANSAVASASYVISATLPKPSFSVASGTYSAAQNVTITDSTSGTTIYYTIDGTMPTTSSSVYSAAIKVASSETIKAIAVKSGSTTSAVASASYVITTTLPTPTFSVAAGTYTTTQSVALSDATAGTTIYYTTDGSTPTTSSSVYSGPISVSTNQTIKAIAVETGYTNSAVASASYVIATVLPAPTFSVAAGTYTTTQSVSLSDATAGTTIYYTTNGSTPTTSSSVYSGPISVSANQTINAIAVASGYTNSPVASAAYVIAPVLPTPTFSVPAGTYTTNQSVSLSDATAGTTIYYTTNGSTPTTSSSVYSGAITVSANETINAIAVASGYTNSAVASASYVIAPVLPTPTFSVPAGTYTTNQSVSLVDATAGTTIYYTTNGSTPTTSSSVYSGAITVSTNETINAIAVASGYTNSAVASASYVIAPVLPAPTFSVPSGKYTTTQLVTLSDATAGVTIYYTTNGAAPTTSSAVYSSPIAVNASGTISAIAAANGYTNSAVSTSSYIIAPVLPTPVFSVPAGTYPSTQAVSITNAVAGTTVYYSTDGTTPTSASAVYSGPINVSATQTLQAYACGAGYTDSPVAGATYTIYQPYLSYSTGTLTASALGLNGGSTVTSNGYLQITDGGAGEARSAWFTTKVPVQKFATSFTFQQINPNADGMTFTIQGQSATAVGGNGGGLGYQGISNSVAIKFDLYSNGGEGADSTGLYTKGVAPTIPSVDLTSTGVNFHSGNLMKADLVYDGTTLTMTITDTVTKASTTQAFTVNIPSIVGSNTAWVGFTGGTGGKTTTQQVQSFSYTAP